MRRALAGLWGAVLGAWAALIGWWLAGGGAPPAMLAAAGSVYVGVSVLSDQRDRGEEEAQ